MALGVVPGDPFDALGDPNRRAIVELLAARDRSVQELADALPISRPAVSRHLRLLKDAGLVTDRAEGTRRLYRLHDEGIAAVRAYLEQVWGDAAAGFRPAAENAPLPCRGMAPPLQSSGLEVGTESTAEAIADGSAQIVDVREDYEREAGYVEGSRHIQLAQLAAVAAELDPERPVIFVCRVGGRSLMAAQALRTAGFDAYSMAGGVKQWADEGRPLAPDGGYVADH